LRLKSGPDARLWGIRGGLRGYLGKIRRYWGRKQTKTCVWVSAVEGRAFLQRSQSIVEGKGTDDIVRDLGKVVIYKDSFKQAGTKVFSKVQYRMEMHNMGRLKFHPHVGVKRLEWMTMGDERTCPVCGPLNGKIFPAEKFPQQPAHPFCRCTNLPDMNSFEFEKIEKL